MDESEESTKQGALTVGQVEVIDAVAPQVDLFGSVDHELSIEDIKRSIRGVSRPRDLRPLIQKSSHDPMLNMLEIAMDAKNKGELQTAFDRFAELLPYIWTRVTTGGALPGQPGAPAVGEVTYRWANPPDAP